MKIFQKHNEGDFLQHLGTARQRRSLRARTSGGAREIPKVGHGDQYLYADRKVPRLRWHERPRRHRFQPMRVWSSGGMVNEYFVKGENGFVCLVERSWSLRGFASSGIEDARAQSAFNTRGADQPASHFKRTRMVLSGMSNDQIMRASKR